MITHLAVPSPVSPTDFGRVLESLTVIGVMGLATMLVASSVEACQSMRGVRSVVAFAGRFGRLGSR